MKIDIVSAEGSFSERLGVFREDLNMIGAKVVAKIEEMESAGNRSVAEIISYTVSLAKTDAEAICAVFVLGKILEGAERDGTLAINL